jgi:hypothetical protein
MKKFVLIIIGLISLPLFGQLTENNKCIIGIYYSPEISYRTLGDSKITQIRNDREVYKYGNSIGATFGYRISKFVEIGTGVNFSSRGFQTKEDSIKVQEPDPVFPDKIKVVDHFYYLGIPLKCGFRKDFNKISVVSSIGIMPNLLLNQKVEYITTKNDQVEHNIYDRTYEYRRIDLTAIISIGLAYKVSHKMDLIIEPTFQHDVISVIDAPLKTYLWNSGLNFSFKYKL